MAETRGTDVDAVAGFADGICAFDSDGVCEIAATAVAFNLKPGFGYGCGMLFVTEISEEKSGRPWISSGGCGCLFLWVMVIG